MKLHKLLGPATTWLHFTDIILISSQQHRAHAMEIYITTQSLVIAALPGKGLCPKSGVGMLSLCPVFNWDIPLLLSEVGTLGLRSLELDWDLNQSLPWSSGHWVWTRTIPWCLCVSTLQTEDHGPSQPSYSHDLIPHNRYLLMHILWWFPFGNQVWLCVGRHA